MHLVFCFIQVNLSATQSDMTWFTDKNTCSGPDTAKTGIIGCGTERLI